VQRARPGRKVDPEAVDMADLTTSALVKAAEEAEQAVTIERSETAQQAQEAGGEP